MLKIWIIHLENWSQIAYKFLSEYINMFSFKFQSFFPQSFHTKLPLYFLIYTCGWHLQKDAFWYWEKTSWRTSPVSGGVGALCSQCLQYTVCYGAV